MRRETFRYWRDQIPRLKEKGGRAAQFTANEIIVLSVISEIDLRFGVKWDVHRMAFEQMFDHAEKTSWFLFQDLAFVLEKDSASLVNLNEVGGFNSAALVVPTGPHLEKLEADLWGEHVRSEQRELPFPLATVSGRANS